MLKIGLAYILTTRGIPQIYYETDILMTYKRGDHGNIRSDFSGGWRGDAVNAFTRNGLSDAQKDRQKYVAKNQKWRKNIGVIHNGKLLHFVPEKGTYTYFRCTDDEAVMIILNKSNTEKLMKKERLGELILGYTSGTDIISFVYIYCFQW